MKRNAINREVPLEIEGIGVLKPYGGIGNNGENCPEGKKASWWIVLKRPLRKLDLRMA